MELQIEGLIKEVGQLQTIQSKVNPGKTIQKREVVITTNEEYPEVVAVELSGDDALGFAGYIGQRIFVSYHFRANKSQEGRWFNSVRAWRVTLGN